MRITIKASIAIKTDLTRASILVVTVRLLIFFEARRVTSSRGPPERHLAELGQKFGAAFAAQLRLRTQAGQS